MITRRHVPRASLSSTLLALLFGAALLTGCGDDDAARPEARTDVAPTLPDPATLTVDLGFFDSGSRLSGETADKFGRQNFFNAYLRAVVVGAMTDLVLAPPVAAFALAVHTVPNHQPDGSWLWVYTFVDGEEEAQIRLRGTVQSDHVDWVMRMTLHDAHHDLDQALWFAGETRNDGADGQWTFHDPDQAGVPAVATLDWHHTTTTHELRLEALQGDDAGDALTFSSEGAAHRIDYHDAGTSATWFIRWNGVDGTGSLQVPDYREGLEACWDAQQYDTDCGR